MSTVEMLFTIGGMLLTIVGILLAAAPLREGKPTEKTKRTLSACLGLLAIGILIFMVGILINLGIIDDSIFLFSTFDQENSSIEDQIDYHAPTNIESDMICVYVTDANNTPLAYMDVHIKVEDGYFYGNQTDREGRAYFSTDRLELGKTYIVSATENYTENGEGYSRDFQCGSFIYTGGYEYNLSRHYLLHFQDQAGNPLRFYKFEIRIEANTFMVQFTDRNGDYIREDWASYHTYEIFDSYSQLIYVTAPYTDAFHKQIVTIVQ